MSIGNILLTQIADDGFVIKLKPAIKIKDQEPSSTLSRTGTKVFIAIRALLVDRHSLMPQYRCIGVMCSHRVTEGDAIPEESCGA